MPRPLSPPWIVACTALLAAALWFDEGTDDFVGLAAAVLLCQLAVWAGIRGDPNRPASTGGRIAVAVGCGIPCTTVVLTALPHLGNTGEGMLGLARVVGGLILGVPIAAAGFAGVCFARTAVPRGRVLERMLPIATPAIVVAWGLVLAWWWPTRNGGLVRDVRPLLAFAGAATAWLLLPVLDLAAAGRRRRDTVPERARPPV